MEESNIDQLLSYGLSKLGYTNIRLNQKKVVEAYLKKKDVFLCSPTGSGKSLCFEISPYVLKTKSDGGISIVVSPLSSLMKTQSLSLNKKGIKAVYLRDTYESGTRQSELEGGTDTVTLEDVKEGKIDILLSSPESILGNQRNLILHLAKDNNIRIIFIDEAHCIVKYGKVDKLKKRAAFRPHYSQLGELRSLAGPNVPVVALTATATKSTRETIIKSLCMTNCEEIIVTPNKKNIKFWVYEMKLSICENFNWLVTMLNTYAKETPRMLIFFRQIKHIAEVYEHLETSLGPKAYVDFTPDGQNDDRNRLFAMFHLKTDDEVKENICTNYQNEHGNIRVVLCSTSFSMGLDVKGVSTVIHYGPANDIDDYMQEVGRCGRDETQQSHAILIKYKRCLGSQNITKEMKTYVLSDSCRRVHLLVPFTDTAAPLLPKHACCDICSITCKCLCSCNNECTCEIKCTGVTSSVLEHMVVCSKPPTDTSSSDSSASDSGCSSSDSDFGVISRKPLIIHDPSDEDSL